MHQYWKTLTVICSRVRFHDCRVFCDIVVSRMRVNVSRSIRILCLKSSSFQLTYPLLHHVVSFTRSGNFGAVSLLIGNIVFTAVIVNNDRSAAPTNSFTTSANFLLRLVSKYSSNSSLSFSILFFVIN